MDESAAANITLALQARCARCPHGAVETMILNLPPARKQHCVGHSVARGRLPARHGPRNLQGCKAGSNIRR
jgi:hypothetical protein